MKLFVVARWNRKDIRRTWSGTGYSLLEGLYAHFQVERISLIDSRWYRYLQIARRLGIEWLSKPLEEIQNRKLQHDIRTSPQTPVLMISGVFRLQNPAYSFVDNAWIVSTLLRSTQAKKNGYFDHFFSYSSSEIRYHIERQYNVFQHSKRIFLMGHWLAEYLKNCYPELASKFVPIGGGCHVHPNTSSSVRKGNKLLFVGKAFYRKGGDLVMEAFRLLREQYRPDAELIIVGPAKRPHGCDAAGITFLGEVSFEQVGILMQQCDVFCMPSRFESYGLVFAEALLSGMPCIGRNAFEMPYFIERGVTGELIEDDNHQELAAIMAKVLSNEEMKRNVSARYNDYRERYSWERVCGEIAQTIQADMEEEVEQQQSGKVSVITINYNGWRDTCELIESMLNCETYPDYEIIVVDNASSGDDVLQLETRNYPHVRVIHSRINLGFAGGNNLGLLHARGEWILFLNNDMLIRQTILSPLVVSLQQEKGAAGVSPMIRYLYHPDKIQYYGYKELSPISVRRRTDYFDPQRMDEYLTSQDIEILHGGAMMFRREAIRKVGEMTEVYFLFYEEFDWCPRFRKAGYTLRYEPEAVVYHKESATITPLSYLREYYLTRGRMIYTRRNSRTPWLRFLSCLYLIGVSAPNKTQRYAREGNWHMIPAVWKGACVGLFARTHDVQENLFP
ncbi:MAG: glycosyltransferase [Prevotellaceae bacterium]|nr:glycosyltransferase [Prevotellaceae bacterium]